MNKQLLLVLLFLFFCFTLSSQIGINSDGSDPDGSAMLDVKSNDSGLLIPRMSEAQRDGIVSPATGLLVFVSDDQNFYFYNGTSWQLFSGGTDGDWTVSGNNVTVVSGNKVGIGTANPDESLHVVGGIKMDDGAQADGKLLMSDSEGKASWQLLNCHSIYGDDLDAPDFSCLSVSSSLGIGYWANDIATSGSHAYVVDAGTDELQVYDVTDPYNPSLSGSLTIGTFPEDMDYAGDYVYVVDIQHTDLKVIDISTPANPVLSGSFSLGLGPYESSPNSVAVEGDHAYVTDDYLGHLKIIDISDPGNLSQTGSLYLGVDNSHIDVAGNYAYIVDTYSDQLKVVDVSNPVSPTLVGSLVIGAEPSDVAVDGNYVYIVDINTDDLKIVDVSNPLNPSLEGSAAIGSEPRALQVANGYVYIVDDGSNDLKVYDVSNSAAPVLVNDLSLGTAPEAIALSGHYAYVVDYDAEDLKVIKLSCSDHNYVSIDPMNGQIDQISPVWMKTGMDLHLVNNLDVSIGTGLPSNKLSVYGNANFTGNVGIGVTSPSQKLTVDGHILQTSGDYLATDRVRARSSGGLRLNDDGGNNGLFVKDGGFVGVGTTNPAYLFNVYRSAVGGSVSAYFEHYGTTGTNYGVLIRAGKDTEAHFLRFHRGLSNAYCGSLYYHQGALQLNSTSDVKLKTNIRDTKLDGLSVLNNLRVVDYDLKSGEETDITGYIAQEVQSAYPNMAYYDQAEDLILISNSQLIPVLHKAIQELSLENEALRTRLDKLESLIQEGGN